MKLFLDLEAEANRLREMKTSAGTDKEVAIGGQHLFWHVALRASHVLKENYVSAYAGVVLSSGSGVARDSKATCKPCVCGPTMFLAR